MDNLAYEHEDYGTVDHSRNSVVIEEPLKRKSWWQQITVEPIVGFYSISISLSLLVVQNLLIKKICWPGTEPGEEECPNEASAEIAEAGIMAWSSLLHNSFPMLFVILAGSWSDNHGGLRKPLIILPVVGQIVADFLLIFNSINWHWSPTVAALSYSLPAGLTGGRVTAAIGVISYIADITSHKNRTFRLSLVVALVFLGMPVGSSLGGVLNKHLGFAGTFAFSIAMNVLGLISLCWVPESGDPKNAKQPGHYCGLNGIMQVYHTIARPRPGYHRICIILLGLSILSLLGPFIGEMSVLYLFARIKFGWTAETFGFFAGVKMIVLFFGTLVIVKTLTLYLKVSDALIGIMASTLQMVPCLVYPFVDRGWIMYVVALTEVMHGTAFTVQKSITTKLVSKEEMGQVNSYLSLVEALVPIIMIPLYNKVYQMTIHEYPGAFFLLSAGITAPAIIIFIVVYFLLDEKDLRFAGDQQDSTGLEESGQHNHGYVL